MNEKFVCPVCAFAELDFPPVDFNICPCCGTEFGYDDFHATWEQLRNEWVENGAIWFSDATLPPRGWNAYRQLQAAGLISAVATDSSDEVLAVAVFAPPARLAA